MIPVENAAGGAAPVFHQQTERTPDQHTNQVADIKDYGDQIQGGFSNPVFEIQHTDGANQNAPQNQYLIGGFAGGQNIGFQGIPIDFIPNGAETMGKELLRPNGDPVSDGDDLENHIRNPDDPEKMQRGKLMKELIPFQNIKCIGTEKVQRQTDDKNQATPDEPGKIAFSCL